MAVLSAPRRLSRRFAPDRSRRSLAVAIGVALLGLATGCERVEEEVEVGYRGPAARNPLLAAERFLEQSGHSAQSLPGYRRPPSAERSLVLPALLSARGTVDPERLVQWVRRGGHLVYVRRGIVREEGPRNDANPRPDPLLERLGIAYQPETEVDGRGPGQRVEVRIQRADRSTVQRVADERGQYPLSIRVRRKGAFHVPERKRAWLRRRDVCYTGDLGAAALLDYSLGKGRVTLVADGEWMTNRRVGSFPHASALLWLFRRDGERRDVWLIYDAEGTLLGLAWRQGWMILVSTAVALAAWVWWAVSRDGPVLEATSGGPVGFDAHLRAAGWYLWRAEQVEALLHPMRQRVRASLAGRGAGLADADERTQTEWLARASGLSAEQVHRAMTDRPSPRDSGRLLAIAQTLQQMERRL